MFRVWHTRGQSYPALSKPGLKPSATAMYMTSPAVSAESRLLVFSIHIVPLGRYRNLSLRPRTELPTCRMLGHSLAIAIDDCLRLS